ncbi:MAG: hypothetical protein GF393_11435 [Armatimonadia bacterium]|nr:hypothetical protein [Armatimonadia bacterium]
MLATIVMLTIIAAPAFAQDAPQLLLHADFESDLTAEVAAGEAAATLLRRAEGQDEVLEKIERAQGVVGEGVVTEDQYVRYPGGANINAQAGTVEIWVKPLDWTGDDELFHVFFNTNNKNPGWLVLYKYFRTEADTGISRKLAFYCQGVPGEDERLGKLMVPSVAIDWQPGTWHHLAATWEKGRAALYVDGAMVRERTGGAVPPGEFSQINFGQPWGAPGPKRSVLDEARIYDAPLTADAIRASFAAGLAQLAEHSPDEMPRATAVVKSLGFPTQQRVAVYVSAAGSPADADDLTGQLSVVPVGGGEPAAVQTLPAFDTSRECFAWLDTSEIDPGEYELRVTITGPGVAPIEATAQHEIPEQPPWWRNDLGMTDEVLPPYEPIETAGLVVSPWGRNYVFSDALILRQLTAYPDPNAQISELAERFHQPTGLLAAPIAVVGSINGRDVRVEAGQPTVVDSAAHVVRVASSASEAGVDFSTEMLLEYDGITQVRLIIEPNGADLSDMAVEIPMFSEQVSLMNFNSVDGLKLNCYAGEAPSGEGVVWEETWLPLIWLGDEYRGLCWFNDRWDGWSGDVMEKGRIQLVRGGDVATLRLNFAPELDAREEPIALNFCLCGTPTRPMPEGWRGLVRDGAVTRPEPRNPVDGPLEKSVDFRVWWSHGPGMTVDHAYPVPIHPEETMRELWQYEEGGPSDIQHHYPNSVMGGQPVSKTWYGDWSSSSTAELLDQLTLKAPGGGRVDWDTNVQDWWLWEINAMMELGLDGMYFDDPYIYPSYNDRTGGAILEEDGTVRPSYGMRGLREYFRRTRALAFEHSDRPWIDIHMSAQLMLPFYVFCDSFLNGEHLNMKLSKEDPDYFDVLPVEELKAQYMGYQWGLAPFLLPELPSDFRRSEPKTREILAYFLPHDVYFWRAWSDPATLNAALKPLQTDFGIGDADNAFLPYWESGEVIGGQTETLVCSAHIKPDRVILVIGNWAEEPAELDLTLDLDALGLADVEDLAATDPVDGAEMTMDGGRLTGSLGARDYRLVLLAGG